MKFNLAISILIHESPSFFEIQMMSIRHFYPNAIIVVHVNEVLWNTKRKLLLKIFNKYNVLVNPNHYVTTWATSSLFDAIFTNINILKSKQDWTHYLFMSSNELFVSNLLEEKCLNQSDDYSKCIVWDSYSDVTSLESNVRDFKAVKYDQGLMRFVADKKVEIKTGLDFGRLITKPAFEKIHRELSIYWENQKNIDVPYSQSEVVLPTVIEYLAAAKEIIMVRNICLSTWISNYNPDSSEEFIIIKKIPRDKHAKVVIDIMKTIGISYSSNIFHKIKSKIKNHEFLSRIFYAQRKIHSNIIKALN